jgi:16S rRNA (cytidine1402-2'-O)-methyltransferase
MSNPTPTVYLIPCYLDENSTRVIAGYVLDAVKECQVFFTENERSARRYLKSLWKDMEIDQYEWFGIHKTENSLRQTFREKLKEGKTIGILSEAGCPGVADPGQLLVATAQEAGVAVKPLVGPNAMLLALMASGMNGQQFHFWGYLPIDPSQRMKTIRELETLSHKQHCTQLFMETPYRNDQLLETLLKTCQPATRLCIAMNLTAANEWIRTRTIAAWKTERPVLHKQPAVFCLLADG